MFFYVPVFYPIEKFLEIRSVLLLIHLRLLPGNFFFFHWSNKLLFLSSSTRSIFARLYLCYRRVRCATSERCFRMETSDRETRRRGGTAILYPSYSCTCDYAETSDSSASITGRKTLRQCSLAIGCSQ